MAISANKKRLSVTLNQEFYDEVMDKSEKLGISASSLIVMYATQWMEQQKIMESMPNMLTQMQNMMLHVQKNTRTK